MGIVRRFLLACLAPVGRLLESLQQANRRLIAHHPNRATALRLSDMAWEEIEHGRLVSAIHLARSAIAADPSWRDGYRMLGLAHLRKGEPEQARRAYEQGEERIGADPFLLGSRADLEWELQRYAEAEATYRRALQAATAPADADKFALNIALAVVEQGRLDEAASLLRDLVARRPEYALALRALGDVYFRQGRFSDAVNAFQGAIRLEPDRARSYYDLAAALAGMQRWQEAAAAARPAVKLEPDDGDYRLRLALLERQESD